jgi:DNA replication protein DnaC
VTDASKTPRPLLDPAAQQPGESPEEWFRRTFGEMPPPAHGTDDPPDIGRDQRTTALSALEKTIPASYRWARFSAPELRQRVPAPALAFAQDAWRHDRVCLMGASRAGKTSLAVAMLRRWASHASRAGVFVHAYRLGVARILHPAGHGEPELVELAMRAPLVLIDDLGGERDHAVSALPDALVERHAENRPTWVTTGLTREQLVKRYGQGIVARVFERATVIHVGAEPALRRGDRKPPSSPRP